MGSNTLTKDSDSSDSEVECENIEIVCGLKLIQSIVRVIFIDPMKRSNMSTLEMNFMWLKCKVSLGLAHGLKFAKI